MKSNPNNAFRDRFALIIPTMEKLSFKVTSCPVPNVSTSGIQLGGSTVDGLLANLDGDRIEYAPAQWQFLVDEDLGNYEAILDWMISNTKSQSDIRLDGSMLIYNSAGSKVVRKITFTEMHPIDIGEVDYGTDEETATRLTCTVTMRFTDFTLGGINDQEIIDVVEHSTPSGIIRLDLHAEAIGYTFGVDAQGDLIIQSDGSATKVAFSVIDNHYLAMDHTDDLTPGHDVEIDENGYLVVISPD